MSFWLYLSYMSFVHIRPRDDIARHGVEIWTKIAGLADANSHILKEFKLK